MAERFAAYQRPIKGLRIVNVQTICTAPDNIEDYEGRWFDLCSGAWRKGEGAYAPYGSGRVWRTQTPKGLDTIAATSEERFYVNLGGVVTITELSAVTATSVTFTWSWL